MKPNNTERVCVVAANLFSHFLFVQHMEYVLPSTGLNLPRLGEYSTKYIVKYLVIFNLNFSSIFPRLFGNSRGGVNRNDSDKIPVHERKSSCPFMAFNAMQMLIKQPVRKELIDRRRSGNDARRRDNGK